VQLADSTRNSIVGTITREVAQQLYEEFHVHEDELDSRCTRQDAIILNLPRACEASIDAAILRRAS